MDYNVRNYRRMKKKDIVYCVICVAVAAVVLDLMGIGCPIKYVTGVSCAGCGLTRAWRSVLGLDFGLAFYYYPLYWLVPIVGGIFWFRERIPGWVWKVAVGGSVIVVLIVYGVRLLDPNNGVVTVDVDKGVIGRMLQFIL